MAPTKKTEPASAPETPLETTPTIHEQIATLAYSLWLERGCPADSPEVDWFKAEAQLNSVET